VTPGAKGQYDVVVNGDVVAAKYADGFTLDRKGFPDDDEAVAAVRAKLGR
jgi:hypothetical protein